MSRRVTCAVLGVVLALFTVPAAGYAQLGGLVKKKAAEKVTGKKDTVGTAATGGQVKCDASKVVITSDLVDRYLKGAAARDAMEQKLAKEPGPTGAYYAALLKRREIEKRKYEFDLRRGPDWEKQVAIQKRLEKGDTAAYSAQYALTQSLDPNKLPLTPPEWETQRKTNASLDSIWKGEAQISDCDWADLIQTRETLPRMVWILAENPSATDFQGFGTAKEGAVLRPRIAELARAMQIKYVSLEDKARLKKFEEEDKAKAEARAAGQVSTGDPKTDCMAKVQKEWSKAHQAEIDKAQEAGDNATVIRLGLLMSAEMAKCN